MEKDQKKLSHDDYTVAWICPLAVEQVAALEMLDEEHQQLLQPETDHNAYNLGSIFNHNVVVASLPTTGNCSAATVVAQMRNTYPRLRFGLLVGIGGGVPTKTREGPIRLGHIVVSQPVGQHSGAVQYDHGKAEASEFVRTGFLAPPPMVLLNAARKLEVARRRASMDPLMSHLKRIDARKRGFREYKRPQADQDQLYESGYTHLNKEESCKKCGCDASKLVSRDVDDSDSDGVNDEDEDWLVVHRGTIASGEKVMRNGLQRDALARDHKILCFEMEAAGALNDFPCFIIRGISDYSDSHKNDKWHGYAAAVAAAYARELFRHMPVEEVKQCKIAETDVEELVQSTKQSADYILDSRVKDWLRPPDASINLVNASKLRHSDTGRWFLESSRYRWFKGTSGASLWLRGIPGCGKTVLSSTIIKDLQLNNQITGTPMIYFFFSFSDEIKQTLDYMLRSLIYQLIGWDKSTRANLLKLFESSRDGREQPQTIQLVEIFNQMVSGSQDLIIVLDALDESKDRRDLLRWITSSANQTCKFILTSRPERDIEECFVPWLSPNSTISLESDLVGDDIEAYVHYRLKEEAHLSRWKSMHEEIVSTLVDKAAGMFRWVYCQLQELSECLDKPAVRRMLHTLPNDLNETYDRILQNIPASRVPNAIKLLQFLAFSQRPLRLEEIIDAVATEPDMKPPFDAENRISPPEAIIGYCSSLVRIVTADSYEFQDEFAIEGRKWPSEPTPRGEIDEENRTIQLAHFSVREYLLLDRRESPSSDRFKKGAANAAIAQILLAYLWTAAEARIPRGRQSEFPLIGVAERYWMKHAASAGEEDDSTFAWTRKIFMNNEVLLYWEQLYLNISDGNFRPSSALYYASHFALNRSVGYLLSMDADPNAEGRIYGNALQGASASGNVQGTRILLDHGASVKAKGGSFGSALHAAAWFGHIDTLQLLLDHGADIGALQWDEDSTATALQVAAYKGHTEILETLLMHGADVNAHNIRKSIGSKLFQSAKHYTALEAASYEGHIKVVKILLNNKAEIDAKGFFLYPGDPIRDEYVSAGSYRYGTPLHAASSEGHLDTVRFLVKSGADINIKSGQYSYALHAALANAHTEVALFLIESGANIHAKGGFKETSLYAAVHGGDLRMVRLLIKSGVDIHQINLINRLEDNALILACHKGSTQIVELLLDNGADVNIQAGYYLNALQSACSNFSSTPQTEVVRLLLENGADVNAKGGEYGTALCAASAYCSLEVVQMLLDKGADVNIRAGTSSSALQLSCAPAYNQPVNPELVRLLLHNGAEVNVQGGDCGTALYVACKKGFDIEIMQILLDKGADPNAHNQGSDTLLFMSSDRGDLAAATLLLSYGADPNVQGGNIGTALAVASYRNSMELVQLLLDNDADVNSPGGCYGNALQSSCCSRSYVKDLDVIRLLLNNGASINAQGGEYGTALCAASSRGELEIVRLLLREGADVNASGGSALCAAAYEGHIDVVRVLLENGAVAGNPTNPYCAALQYAIQTGNRKIAELFFKEGALKMLAEERANAHRGFKRSRSTSNMSSSAEKSSRKLRIATTQSLGARRMTTDNGVSISNISRSSAGDASIRPPNASTQASSSDDLEKTQGVALVSVQYDSTDDPEPPSRPQKSLAATDQVIDNAEHPHGLKLAVIVVALCLATLLAALDQTIMATAAPKITDHFKSIDDIGCSANSPKLDADSYVRRLISLTSAAPLQRRPAIMGIVSSMWGVASAAGPLLGGVFTDKVSWRWCFYINLPIGALIIVMIAFLLRVPRLDNAEHLPLWQRIKKLDLIGASLLIPATVCLLLGLQWGGTTYSWNDPHMIALFVAGGVLTVAFIYSQSKLRSKATLPPYLFKNRNTLCFGVGIGFEGGIIAVQTVLSGRDIPVAISVVSFFMTIGGAVFVPTSQTVFQNEFLAAIKTLAPHLDGHVFLRAGATQVREILSMMHEEDLLDSILKAYCHALQNVFWVVTACTIASVIAACGLEWKSVRKA
ncbi:Pfs, NACHT and ankyrin domain protein, partial [Aureobasidium melanogenum]